MCIEDSRLRACSLASNKKANQNSGAKHALCDKEWTPVFFMIAGVNFALILSSLRGPASISTNSFFLCLYHIPQPLPECSCIRVLHPRVISPRQHPSMVLEVYVLARTTFKFPRYNLGTPCLQTDPYALE